MEIRNNADSLKTLLGVPSTTPTQTQPMRGSTVVGQSGLIGDHATLSSAGTEVAQSALDGGVRSDKVAQVQAALAAGTYNVSPGEVAGKVIDSMLSGDRG